MTRHPADTSSESQRTARKDAVVRHLSARRRPSVFSSGVGAAVCLLLAFQPHSAGSAHGTSAGTATFLQPVALAGAHVSSPRRSPNRMHFVNCRTGSDRTAGTRRSPWATPAAVTRRSFAPGSTVSFARGCTWRAPLTLRGSGTGRQPIVVTSYGNGTKPTFTDQARDNLATIDVVGDHVTVEHLKVTGAAQYAIAAAGSHDTIARDTVTRSGGAVLVTGPHALVNEMRASNLHMISNTPGGDDDYGAVGYDIQAPHATVANSSCTNCRAASYDYGHDGGFVEIWNSGDDLSVHNNVATNTQGFLEIGGGPKRRHANNVTVAHNTMIQVHGGFCIHGHGKFAIDSSRITISHNLIINKHSHQWGYVLGGTLKAVKFVHNQVRSDLSVARTSPAIHYDNRYRMRDGARVGF